MEGKQLRKNNAPVEFTENDYEYMKSLSAAILQKTPSKISRVLKIWLITIVLFIVWASYASIDEITRGNGKVIPFGQNQIIQNLEGGIVDSILINEGQSVKEGQVILKIRNAKSLSSSLTNQMKYEELEAKRARLYAEANGVEFKATKSDNEELNKQMRLAEYLYQSNRIEYLAKDNAFNEQIKQKEQAYKEAKARVSSLQKSLEFANEEISMTEPMVREGVKSKVDFLKLKREASSIENDIEAAKLSLPRLLSAIEEIKSNRKEAQQQFIGKAKQELNEVTAELARLKTQQIEYTDQVERTVVKSPVDGIVQKLYVNTIGGVIKPGADLVEIVPTNKRLFLEVKIKPNDIAYLHPGAEAKVKVSAYDFALYGGLVGEVVNISPDTIVDEKGDTYYLINVETTKSYLGTDEHPLKIIPGMVVSVDIITGKKTVMQYILKPILKSKQYVFSER